jgi:hypothetical protein
VQIVSTFAPSVAGPPVTAGDAAPGAAQSDFLAILLSAGLDFPQSSIENNQGPTSTSIRTLPRDDEPEQQHEEKLQKDLRDKIDAAIMMSGPQLPAPPPAPVTLRFSLAPDLSVELPSDSGQTSSGILEQETETVGSETIITRSHRDAATSGTGFPIPDETPDSNTAFTLRLSHSLDQVDSGPAVAANNMRLVADTKQTQFSPVLPGIPSTSMAAVKSPALPATSAPHSPLSSQSPQSTPVPAASTQVTAVHQSGAQNERRDEPDHGQQYASPDAEPHAPAKAEPAANLAVERAIPIAVSPGPTGPQRPSQVTAEPSISRAAAPEPPTQTAKDAPLREITLKLPGNADKSVDLHIVDERGKLHVEVRTSDAQLASSLRDNVGELVQKLDRSGFHAETTSGHESAPISTGAAQGSGLGNESGHKPGGGEQQTAGQGGDGQAGQQHQQGQGRGNRPRWLEEIVRNFHSSEQEKEKET